MRAHQHPGRLFVPCSFPGKGSGHTERTPQRGSGLTSVVQAHDSSIEGVDKFSADAGLVVIESVGLRHGRLRDIKPDQDCSV